MIMPIFPNSTHPLRPVPSRPGSRGRHPASAAFTLVEVLITTALLLVVMGLLFIPISSSLGYFRTATARADAQSVARIALDAVARELAEAMYVQLDMYDNTMVAFVPPLRVDPNDPNSEIVTPPRPDWSRATRFWRALNDPTRNYKPDSHLEPGNMYYVARTVVPNPFYHRDDAWNRWSDTAWAQKQPTSLPGMVEGVSAWAPIPRVVHTDVDYRPWDLTTPLGVRNSTLQPGYPYLWVQHALSTGQVSQTEAARLYRNNVVALTPNAPEYDVPQLTFNPTAVAGERLRPVEGADGPDYSVYRSRYPLWRQGTPYTGWSVLAQNPTLIEIMGSSSLRMDTWARDPFLLISRYQPSVDLAIPGRYELQAIGAFDPRTRTMKVFDLTRNVLYDTGMPPEQRAITTEETKPWFGFTVDWVDASLRFDFPAELVRPPSAETEFPLHAYWLDEIYRPNNRLGIFVIPDSVSVKEVVVDSSGEERVVRVLNRVDCKPREGRDEFQLGTEPTPSGTNPRYGWIRLPETTLSGGGSVASKTFWVQFRWRNNGVVPPNPPDGAPYTMRDEKPDIITAYYRSAAIIDVNLTVTRADPSAMAGQRITQSSFLTRRVKLHNLLREIRYGED